MKDTTEGRMMQDKIETIGETVIQHGKINNRIYLMKFSPEDVSTIIYDLEKLAKEHDYTKILAKIYADALPYFVAAGYHSEAFIPKFYNYSADCLLVSKFLDQTRDQINAEELEIFKILLNASRNTNGSSNKEQNKYLILSLHENDVNQITEVFKAVFETYPFPVYDPNYIVKTMRENGTKYYGIRDGEKLIGISTAEIDYANRNAEMTDFAVLPEYRGQRFAYRLLRKMESEMKADNILTVYTIARLKEPGMNKTFLNSGYRYTGTLVNNTNIGGCIESMNVLYKHL